MATALQAQLAQIASKSSDPLNLKAQREGYSKSLLYEPSVAARQDLETLYDVCVEGFRELCEIDRRFEPYARSIFSEQSKKENRLQMTSIQNTELDSVLESFLGLVASRLLLKPAVKALEWLVRQFRVHQHNTEFLLCILIPYHSQPLFATVLSILPLKLPSAFKFLAPCVERLRVPSRSELVYALTRHSDLFRLWNSHILSQCQSRHEYREMLNYWAAAITEAALGRIDQATRGNEASQRQKEESLLFEILPILNDGLQISHSAEMRIGCLMLLAVLASKIDLQDHVLNGMLEAVVQGHSQETYNSELICLAVLVQNKPDLRIPRTVFKFLRSVPLLANDLALLSSEYNVSCLANAVAKAMLRSLRKHKGSFQPSFITSIIDEGLISMDESLKKVVSILSMTSLSEKNSTLVIQVIEGLCASQRGRKVVLAAVNEQEIILDDLTEKIGMLLRDMQRDTLIGGGESLRGDPNVETATDEENKALMVEQRIIDLPKAPTRFFTAPWDIFERCFRAFQHSAASSSLLLTFLKSKFLDPDGVKANPAYLSFFLRVWGSTKPSNMRLLAIHCIRDSLADLEVLGNLETQILLPYILTGLKDLDSSLRAAAAELLVVLQRVKRSGSLDDSHFFSQSQDSDHPIVSSGNRTWLSSQDTQILMDLLILHCEEFSMDSNYLAPALRQLLIEKATKKSTEQSVKGMKSAQKESILAFLANQTIHTPLEAHRLQLLNLLRESDITSSHIRKERLLTIPKAFNDLGGLKLARAADREGVATSDLAAASVSIISPKDSDGLKFLQDVIKNSRNEENASMQHAALAHIPRIWGKLGLDQQCTFAALLINASLVDETITQTGFNSLQALETLHQLHLCTEVLERLLLDLPAVPVSSVQEHSSPNSKRRKIQHQNGTVDPASTPYALNEYQARVTTTLELIESSKNGSDISLMEPLFGLLADIHRIKDRSRNNEYNQLTLLSTLNAIMARLKREKTPLQRSVIRADMVVDYFRNATNTQLQQASLLLLSNLAVLVPNQVIHSIMPIFTFMGSTLLRLSDDYSTLVVDQTIQSIIPPLIDSLRKDKRGPLAGASELLLSFVAAYDHIPIERRKNLFIVLVNKLGPEDFLYALVAMLMERHAYQQKVCWFAVDLVGYFHPIIQFQTVERFLDLLLDTLSSKPSLSRYILSDETTDDREGTVVALSRFPIQLLKNSEFTGKVWKISEDKSTDTLRWLRSSFASVLESTLHLQEYSQANSRLRTVQAELLEASLGTLPFDEAIGALYERLQHGDDKVRTDMLRSLHSRISAQKPNDPRSRKASLDLLPVLCTILTSTSDTYLKATCVSCLDSIAEVYGKANRASLDGVASTLIGVSELGSRNTELQIRVVLCLTTLVETLEENIVIDIPKAAPLCLSLLEQSKKRSADTNLVQAGFSFFNALLLYIPYILTGDYLYRLLQSAFTINGSELGSAATRSRTDCLALVPKCVSLHECLVVLDRLIGNLNQVDIASARHYLPLLRDTVRRQTKAEAVRYSSMVKKLCLDILDQRCLTSSVVSEELSKLSQTEEDVYEILMGMIYKLNDANFRPLFSQLLEWTHAPTLQPAEQQARASSFYGFVGHFLGTLKSVVTNYGGLVVEDAVEVLESCQPEDSSVSLWMRLLSALAVGFKHDQEGFWQAPARFSSILGPLTSQLGRVHTEAQSIACIQCVTELARAADGADNLKAINSAVLPGLRSDSQVVRLNAVRCQQSLTGVLGEDWLALLPEMLPFISEAVEDEDEEVETLVRAWVRQIEEVLGENLDTMLQ